VWYVAAVTNPILLYDGVCGFCDRSVQFVLRHDRAGRVRFAPLQSGLARDILARHGCDARDLDTMYLVFDADTPGERLLRKSDGILALLGELDGPWRLLTAARWVPRGLRDRAYDWLARNRYRWFGKYDHCALPRPELRDRFLDGGSPG
jgi:predicted DCC family thiol-disulfide oxidoreductase YuxK